MNMDVSLETKKLLTNIFAFISAIHRTGSYTKAAELLHKKQSQISREIHRAEEMFDVKLVMTNTRGAFLTPDGLRMLEFAEKQNELFYNASNFSLDVHNISGNISIAVTDGIGIYLIPYLVEFQKLYPKVNINLISSRKRDNFADGPADIAIAYKYPNPCNGLDVAEYTREFGLFASVDFIKEYKMPKDINDLLKNYNICDRQEYSDNWKEWRGFMSKAAHKVASFYSSNLLILATSRGMGVSLQPVNYGKDQKNWMYLDCGVSLKHSCWVISRQSARKIEKIRVMLDFIHKIMANI